MYIRVKQRDNKHSERVFYLYLCQSKRIEAKVTNKQKYLVSVREQDLVSGYYKEKFRTKLSFLEHEEMHMLEKKLADMIDVL